MRKVVRIADVEKLLGKESAEKLAAGIDKMKAKPKRGPIAFVVTTRWAFTASQEINAKTGYEALDLASEDLSAISEGIKLLWREHMPVASAEVVFSAPNMREGFVLPMSVHTERKFKIERKAAGRAQPATPPSPPDPYKPPPDQPGDDRRKGPVSAKPKRARQPTGEILGDWSVGVAPEKKS